MSLNETGTLSVSSEEAFKAFPNPLAELQEREASITRSIQSTAPADQLAAIGEQLIIIRDKSLYRLTGARSFKEYLDKRRTPISRARAYQLMHFAAARRSAQLENRPMPANERQYRTTKSPGAHPKTFEQCWRRTYNFLSKELSSYPVVERPRFAQTLRVLADIIVNAASRGEGLQPLKPPRKTLICKPIAAA
jgi:hypothetical protein